MAIKQNPINKGLSHSAVLGLRVLGVGIKLSPPALWGAVANFLTPILWIVLSSYRRNTLKNLVRTGHTMEEARALGKKSFRSNLLTLFESLSLPRLFSKKGVCVENRISPEAEKMIQKIRSGRETMALAVSGHTGVWELLGADLSRLCAPTPVVVSARLVGSPIMARFLVRQRRDYGIKLVEAEKVMRYLLNAVRTGSPNVYAFLCDQHFKGGVKVPFMGKNACTATFPAALILKFDWPVLLGRCIRRAPGNYLIEFDLLDPSPFRELSKDDAIRGILGAINSYIEESIARAPEQWTWGHKRWKNCCGPESRIESWPG